MKKYPMSIFKTIFNYEIFMIFMLILKFKTIKSFPNFKTIHISNNNYWIITQDSINYYSNDQMKVSQNFQNDQKINSVEELDAASLGVFKEETGTANLLVVKDYVYAIMDGNHICNTRLTEITDVYSLEVDPYKCSSNYCFYVVGVIKTNKDLVLYLYKNPSTSCSSEAVSTITINNVGSNLKCEIMITSANEKVLTCFYQDNNSNQIIAKSFNINIQDINNPSMQEISSLVKSKENLGAKVIRSILSQDGKKTLVCYINDDNNCDCLIYDITSNTWSDYSTYLNDCLSGLSSINIEYFENQGGNGEYILYCYQSEAKIQLMTFDSDFNKKVDSKNGYYDLSEDAETCLDFYLSSLFHNTNNNVGNNNNINIFATCDGTIQKMDPQYEPMKTTIVKTTIPTTLLKTTIPTTLLKTTIPTTLPKTTIPTTLPKTTIPTTLPRTTMPTTLPKTTIPTALPKTTIPKNSPKTTIPTTISKTKIPTTIPKIISKTTIATTILQTTILEKKSKITSTLPSSHPSIKTTIYNSIISFSSLINEESKNNNNYIIIHSNSNKTKEEIIDNLDTVMEEYDIGKIYEIIGDDYNVKISPINVKEHDTIATYIDFANCEKILRESKELDPSSLLSVYQIEIYNNHEQTLINNVEYAVFNEEKQRLDLSVCENEKITINYQLNTTMINMSKVNYYSDLGIDVFNIEDDFFNDICYSYSEEQSDIILKDRVSDIYHNYTVCENNCKYNNINLTENTVNCSCNIKTKADLVVESPKLDKMIRDTFVDSNLAIIKCYNLVFGFENKHQNIGFWIFTILIVIHFPLFIYYFIYNISSIRKFIFQEMNRFHYCTFLKNPPKKEKNSKKRSDKKKIINKNNSKELLYSKKKLKGNNSSAVKLIKSNVKLINKHIPSINNNNNYKKPNKKYDILDINPKKKQNKKQKEYRRKKSIQQLVFFDYKVLNKNYINMNRKKNRLRKSTINVEKIKNYKKEKNKLASKNYFLIHIDANNSSKNKPPNSEILLDNYDYETAIKYEKRHFWRIFFICMLNKENIINIILYKTPLDVNSLRICLFIFTYSCDLAFNTIFYTNDNISDRYHYEGEDLLLFSLVNNIVISLTSFLTGIILTNVFQHLIDSRNSYEEVFRIEEKKMRKLKTYKVSEKTKSKIFDKIGHISTILKIKIVVFIILEFSIMLFFYYFVTAFCEVYKKTQISWLVDFFSSFLISLFGEICLSLLLTVLYIISINYKIKIVYTITLFIYNL